MLFEVSDSLLWISLGMLAYAHIIYPLLMALASRRLQPSPQISAWPSVSLIIPAHNESPVIDAKLSNAMAIDYPRDRLEVIVASDGSSDDTVEQALAYESRGVKVLDLKPRRGKASALNDAVAASRGDVICLCDANVMFRPESLRALVAHFADPTVGAVTGDVRLASEQSDFGEGEGLYYKLERAVQRGESWVGSVVCVDGGLYIVRRELYRQLAADTVLDDLTTTMNVIRQRRRVVYEPRAIADENGTPHWRDEYRRRVRTTAGAVQSIKRGLWPPISRPIVLWQYVSHKLLRWLGPVWLIGLLISSCGLWSSHAAARGLLIGQGVMYGGALAALCSPRFRCTKPGAVVFYYVMSHCAMLVGLLKGLSQNPLGSWERTPRPARSVVQDVATRAAEGSSRVW